MTFSSNPPPRLSPTASLCLFLVAHNQSLGQKTPAALRDADRLWRGRTRLLSFLPLSSASLLFDSAVYNIQAKCKRRSAAERGGDGLDLEWRSRNEKGSKTRYTSTTTHNATDATQSGNQAQCNNVVTQSSTPPSANILNQPLWYLNNGADDIGWCRC